MGELRQRWDSSQSRMSVYAVSAFDVTKANQCNRVTSVTVSQPVRAADLL